MPFVPVENTALVETRMMFDGQKCENTIWVENEAAWDGASLAELASEVKDWWVANYAGLVTFGTSLTEVVATDMSSDTGPQASVAGGGEVGLGSGAPFPGGTSFVVSFRTALRGRSFRGRNYIVGVPEASRSLISGVDSDYVEACVNAYTALLDAISTAGWTWVIASRFSGVDPDTHNPIPRVAGVTTPVTNVVCTDATLDSQRRRLPGRGQ